LCKEFCLPWIGGTVHPESVRASIPLSSPGPDCPRHLASRISTTMARPTLRRQAWVYSCALLMIQLAKESSGWLNGPTCLEVETGERAEPGGVFMSCHVANAAHCRVLHLCVVVGATIVPQPLRHPCVGVLDLSTATNGASERCAGSI